MTCHHPRAEFPTWCLDDFPKSNVTKKSHISSNKWQIDSNPLVDFHGIWLEFITTHWNIMESWLTFRSICFKFQQPTSTLHVKPFFWVGRKKTFNESNSINPHQPPKPRSCSNITTWLAVAKFTYLGPVDSVSGDDLTMWRKFSPSNLWRKLVSLHGYRYPQDVWNDTISSYENLTAF